MPVVKAILSISAPGHVPRLPSHLRRILPLKNHLTGKDVFQERMLLKAKDFEKLRPDSMQGFFSLKL